MPGCHRCSRSDSGPQAFLLCCSECRKYWHHRCHIPPVQDDELVRRLKATNENDVDNGIYGWTCRRCSKTAVKLEGKAVQGAVVVNKVAPANLLDKSSPTLGGNSAVNCKTKQPQPEGSSMAPLQAKVAGEHIMAGGRTQASLATGDSESSGILAERPKSSCSARFAAKSAARKRVVVAKHASLSASDSGRSAPVPAKEVNSLPARTLTSELTASPAPLPPISSNSTQGFTAATPVSLLPTRTHKESDNLKISAAPRLLNPTRGTRSIDTSDSNRTAVEPPVDANTGHVPPLQLTSHASERPLRTTDPNQNDAQHIKHQVTNSNYVVNTETASPLCLYDVSTTTTVMSQSSQHFHQARPHAMPTTASEIDGLVMDVDAVNLTPVKSRNSIQGGPPLIPTRAGLKTEQANAAVSPLQPISSALSTDRTSPSAQEMVMETTEEALIEDQDIEDLYWNPPSCDTASGLGSPMQPVSEPTVQTTVSADPGFVALSTSRVSENTGLATWWMHEHNPDDENPWNLRARKLGGIKVSRGKVRAKRVDQCTRVPVLTHFFVGNFRSERLV